ncbi:MAG TPA: transcription-repair coupling factor [Dongiaceae bacterium]|jgi:transcription-repair coupling factor (superfamily II helicase)|nr:transcription-repair coupling factor [Dongiaceae bacterium]
MFDAIPQRAAVVARAPDSYVPVLLGELARDRNVLFIAEDDQAMRRLEAACRFFAPSLTVLAFPAWDCLPYDRASPHSDIMAARLGVLHELAGHEAQSGLLLLTTVAAMLQRVPPPEWIRTAALSIRPGMTVPPERLRQTLIAQGYRETAVVNEPGDFAQRGGIIDFFAPGKTLPVRLDYFGDDIESLRAFDPSTQRSQDPQEDVLILPASELEFNAETIASFRTQYRALFGTVDDDPLYEAISAGRRFAGMEHWLPLFRSDLTHLGAYLPQAVLAFGHHAEQAMKNRHETIQDFYRAREELRVSAKELNAPPYRPLPPERLYLTDKEYQTLVQARQSFTFHPAAVAAEPVIDAGAAYGEDFAPVRHTPDLHLYEEAVRRIRARIGEGIRVLLTASSFGAVERLGQLLKEHGLDTQQIIEDGEELGRVPSGIFCRAVLPLQRGFIGDVRGNRLWLLTDQDLLGDRLDRGRARPRRAGAALLADLAQFEFGDFVVHEEHGVGRYEGLETLDVGGAPHGCVKLIYHGGDKLYVPVENIDILSRYGGEEAAIELDKLGSTAWQARKARVRKRVREIAEQLIRTAAARVRAQFEPLAVPPGAYDEFCAGFPYAETEDQERAIEDVLNDLHSGRPMDRLVCGDVGFGKTEVALRAAFVAALSGKQVALIAPTTLLARQHHATFAERFRSFPVRIGVLSRLTKSAEVKRIKQELAEGRLDIVVGTHALLAKDIAFSRLGLVIIDEEQHFGVAQKERLKELREGVHVLTLSATPIPRTLQMALTGLRDMSVIATPPIDRLAVRTFALPYDPVILREAMMREHFRGGQIFYVCPRIEDLDRVHEQLRTLVPDLKVVVAHGQMAPTQLEKAMNAFYDGAYDILLSTNIVESGLDIPRANTMIIHRADILGLAQLYQLRGRIGRSKLRAHCYLTVPNGKLLTETARKRLEVMQSLDQLGAGFTLATQDMDIRGAGNLLGEEQSGQVREVGVELYQHLLQEAVATAQNRPIVQSWSPQINLGMAVMIPDDYVPDATLRLGLYRRLGEIAAREELDNFAAEMIDRFGIMPAPFRNLLTVVEIKILCRKANIEKIDAGPRGATVAFRNNRFPRPEALIALIARQRGAWMVRPDQRLTCQADWQEDENRALGARDLVRDLADLAQ